MLASLQGESPTRVQVIGTWTVFFGAAGLVLMSGSIDWKLLLVAFIAGDWAGGVVANAAESTRDWWRDKTRARQIFHIAHVAEVPLVWWLTGGGWVFYVLMVVLIAKLAIFEMGAERAS